MSNWYIRFVVPGASFSYSAGDFPFLPRVGDKVVLLSVIRTVIEVLIDVNENEIVIRFKEMV